MIDDRDRMEFFALATLLEGLCAPEASKRLENLCALNSDNRKRAGLLFGYKMVIKAVLYKQIELIIHNPKILGLQQVDVGLCHWWVYSETKYANRFRQVMSDDAPESALIGNHINNLLLGINRSGPELERFRQAASDVYKFATSLSMVPDCRLSLITDTKTDSLEDVHLGSVDQALRLCAVEYLHDIIYHRFAYDMKDRTLDDSDLYANANSQSWEDGDPLEDLGMADEVETSRDVVGRRTTNRHSGNSYCILGINAAVTISLHWLGLQNQVLYRESEQLLPDDEIFCKLLDDLQPGKYPSQTYELALNTEIRRDMLESIMSSYTSLSKPTERIADLLGNRAFLISSLRSYNHSAFHVQALVRGLMASVPKGQKVEVLRIDHKASPDERHPPISLAVSVSGDWQVFYRVDAIGRMKSGIFPWLESLEDRIDFTTIEGVDTKSLLRICDRSFQYVARKLKRQTDINRDLRGKIPELLASILLAKTGYHHFTPSLEIEGVDEIDVAGIRDDGGGECLLVEVKRGSTTQIQLISELKKFRMKVESVRENSDAVVQALGYSGSIQRVSGLFITMANVGDLESRVPGEATAEPHDSHIDWFFSSRKSVEADFKEFIENLPDIRFWDYNEFDSALKSAGLPELPQRLRERANIVWESPGYDRDEWPDVFGTLEHAVKSGDWQWPDSEEAIQNKLDRLLRGE